jgi:hypothetical protein
MSMFLCVCVCVCLRVRAGAENHPFLPLTLVSSY